jgi:hypothetical protein
MELANSIVTLQPGMYILRHPKTGMPPLSISRAAARPEHSGHVQALFTPKTEGSVLRDGTDCIVMQVLNAPVDLLVTAYLEKAGVSVPALKIDKIRLDGDEVVPQRLEVPGKGLSLVGHIERTGDVLAKPGERLGVPDSNLRLEGFQVMWPDKPEGVDLEYSVVIEGAGESPTVRTGHFCGTKNAARRIVGVKFGLVGEKAKHFELSGNVHFSGGYAVTLSAGKASAGPTGMEHLTALDVRVSPAKKNGGSWDASLRTKIFKANDQAKRKR